MLFSHASWFGSNFPPRGIVFSNLIHELYEDSQNRSRTHKNNTQNIQTFLLWWKSLCLDFTLVDDSESIRPYANDWRRIVVLLYWFASTIVLRARWNRKPENLVKNKSYSQNLAITGLGLITRRSQVQVLPPLLKRPWWTHGLSA